jgi:hypothetical protein
MLRSPVVIVLALAACSNSQPQAVILQGKATYADGTPVDKLSIRFNLVASGEGLFPAGVNNCDSGDAHGQAIQVITAATTEDGSFSFQAPLTGFACALDVTCTMPAEAVVNISRLDVLAQADADFFTCLPYCRVHLEDTCYSDCASRGQKFVSTSTFSGTESASAINITFANLGPPLAGTPDTPPLLPDLQVDGDAAQSSLHITNETFAPSDCVVADACIGAPGDRTLLRFDGDIVNLGNGDLMLGDPEDSPLFTFSECHQRYHVSDSMSFELLDANGGPVFGDTGAVVGRKQAFCMEDVMQVAGQAPSSYVCNNQGLTTGWEDVYPSSLDCQWLDITGVAPGDYTLRITANPLRIFPESNYDNNAASIPVTIPAPDP